MNNIYLEKEIWTKIVDKYKKTNKIDLL